MLQRSIEERRREGMVGVGERKNYILTRLEQRKPGREGSIITLGNICQFGLFNDTLMGLYWLIQALGHVLLKIG